MSGGRCPTPAWLLPYFAGVLHSINDYDYNILLGTYKPVSRGAANNAHIHIDEDYSQHKNFLGFESPDGKPTAFPMTENMIPYIFQIYGFGLMTTMLKDLAQYETKTKELLLNNNKTNFIDYAHGSPQELKPITPKNLLDVPIPILIIGLIAVTILIKSTLMENSHGASIENQ